MDLDITNALVREDLGSFLFFTIPRDKTKIKYAVKHASCGITDVKIG